MLEHAKGKALPNVTVEDFRNVPGEGLTARVTLLTSRQETARLGTIEFVTGGISPEAAEGIREAAAKEAGQGKESVMAAMSVGSKVGQETDKRIGWERRLCVLLHGCGLGVVLRGLCEKRCGNGRLPDGHGGVVCEAKNKSVKET